VLINSDLVKFSARRLEESHQDSSVKVSHQAAAAGKVKVDWMDTPK
jgi:hypothetical protein